MTARTLLPPALAMLLAAGSAAAQTGDVRIDISSAGGHRIPILCEALKPAGDRNAGETSVTADATLADDLQFSAVFEVTRSWTGATPPADAQAVVSGTWTVSGNVVTLAGDVRDLPGRRPIFSKQYRGTVQQRRSLAHQFADDVVLQFTGEAGISQTRIAFAVPSAGTKEIWVMDYDGTAPQQLTKDRSIALSPSWSPEGSLLLFTSYRSGTGPKVYVMPSIGGRTYLLSGKPGNNTSACYSPDGRDVALTLSQDGNSEIYLVDARGGTPRRLTENRAIDTSPAWSPTGREIAFTSDRGGGFQVYLMDRYGGNVRRLTFDVSGTDSPAWSPKGDQIAFVARTDQGFDIYVCKVDGTAVRRVVAGGSNENPKWAPDGRHLVFSSNRDGETALWVTDLDDRPPRKLVTTVHPALSPAWSPRPGGASSMVQRN